MSIKRSVFGSIMFGLTLLISACSTMVPKPDVTQLNNSIRSDNAKSNTAENMSPNQAYDRWDSVLKAVVNTKGEVNFTRLQQGGAPLENLQSFVAWIYANSPSNRPGCFVSKNSQLAYHLNAYNALAMYGVLKRGVPESLGGLSKITFFYLTKFKVGGEEMSLYDYENKVIRPMGDARIHFVLNCMAVSCPILPREAVRPDNVQAILKRETQQFFASPTYLQVNTAEQKVTVSAILDFYPEDFIQEEGSLIAYINKHYRPSNKSANRNKYPIPANYTVEFFDYDWTVNAVNR